MITLALSAVTCAAALWATTGASIPVRVAFVAIALLGTVAVRNVSTLRRWRDKLRASTETKKG